MSVSDRLGPSTDAGADAFTVRRLRERIYRECDATMILAAGAERAAVTVEQLVRGFLAEERRMLERGRVDAIVASVVAATTGLGPIDALFDDPTVSEVMVNGPDTVYVERSGLLERVSVCFDDEAHLRQVVDRILAPIGRRIDASSPLVDARLPDGSRVNVVVPPLSVEGTVLTIRRFLPIARSLGDLVGLGAFDAVTEHHLRAVVAGRRNGLVVGGTSSGKTTLLAGLVGCCAGGDRIVVIEDSAELPIDHAHRIRLEARPPVLGGGGEVRVRDLVRNALRMRPDRIVVGEVRGPEAFDLVQALNTGHRGCWSTVHANGPEDGLLRLESMVLESGVAIPQTVVRTQIARAIDVVIHTERDEDGRRRVQSVSSVTERDGGWTLRELHADPAEGS